MDNLAVYSEAEFQHELSVAMKRSLLSYPSTPSDRPCAFLLGGQSGAGKTKLHKILSAEFGGDAIVINGDEYRSLHPRYRELDAAYGPEAVSHTAPWAGKMTEALIDAFSTLGYNLIIEGTLRTAEVPLKTAKLLRERGYAVSLALMAVKPEISLVSCQIRYEMMRLAGTIPRATDSAHHNKIVNEIVSNVATLEQSGLFDDVRLYTRAGECVYPADDTALGEGEPSSASAALRSALFGPWTEEESLHLKYLHNKLSALKRRA